MSNTTRARWLTTVVFLAFAFLAQAQQVRSEKWSANVYPNPSDGIVHVELSGKYAELTHINIVDDHGRSVYVDDVFNDRVHRIDLRSVPKGTYTMRLTSTNVYMRQTLVIL